jgi:hypothetical protein
MNIIYISILCLSSFAKCDTVEPKKIPDSIAISPEVFKMEMSGQDLQTLIDALDKEIQDLNIRKQKIIAMAQKQFIKKPK